MGPYRITGFEGDRPFPIFTDDRGRAVELAGIMARTFKRVEVERDGESFTYPKLEDLR